jgi:hypothetical protein
METALGMIFWGAGFTLVAMLIASAMTWWEDRGKPEEVVAPLYDWETDE